jgi:OmpA-OmpF porin, OOP family
MSRSEARTGDAWRGYDRAALGIALLGLLALLVLWWLGYGPNRPGCCAEVTAAVPAAVQPAAPPPPVMAPAPEPARVEAPKAEAQMAEAPAVAAVERVRAATDCKPLATDGVTVEFPFADAALDELARTRLDQILGCLSEGRYQVAGHTSSVGDAALNQRLSEARAQSVVAYLVGKGLPASRFVAIGFGETQPIADNATDEGRAKNRRATLTLLR